MHLKTKEEDKGSVVTMSVVAFTAVSVPIATVFGLGDCVSVACQCICQDGPINYFKTCFHSKMYCTSGS